MGKKHQRRSKTFVQLCIVFKNISPGKKLLTLTVQVPKANKRESQKWYRVAFWAVKRLSSATASSPGGTFLSNFCSPWLLSGLCFIFAAGCICGSPYTQIIQGRGGNLVRSSCLAKVKQANRSCACLRRNKVCIWEEESTFPSPRLHFLVFSKEWSQLISPLFVGDGCGLCSVLRVIFFGFSANLWDRKRFLTMCLRLTKTARKMR